MTADLPCTRLRPTGSRLVSLLLALLSLAWAPAARADASPRRNVLLIIADDLRPSLGCYGDPQVRTPALDKLASNGALFQRAYVSQAWCSPARTAMLTGLRPGTTRVYDLETHFRTERPDALTLPQYFKQHGYYTAALGKVFHGDNDDPTSWSEATWTPTSPAYLLADNQREGAFAAWIRRPGGKRRCRR